RSSDLNMYRRITAQRMIVEENKSALIPALIDIVQSNESDFGVVHALWALEGLGAMDGSQEEALTALHSALNYISYAVQRAALAILPKSEISSDQIAQSGFLTHDSPQVRLDAILKAGELPDT